MNLSVKIGNLKLKNPVMAASGTFGYAEEFRDFLDLRKLGAIISKTITLKARPGNPPPRTCETAAGMLNSIGLENPGVEAFIKEKLAALLKIGVPIIVSIASEENADEFITLAKRLDKVKGASAIELNISCPNIRRSKVKGQRSKLISQDAEATYEVVRRVRRVTAKTLIAKLSPNVTDITEIALAAERAGADAVSLINTLTGMCIDTEKRAPVLGAVIGGLSGPAVRPVAVRMAWECYQKIKIPIVGLGGIMDIQSALEFFICGATAIAIGTANFINPRVTTDIIEGLRKYLLKNKIKDINSLTGSLKI